MSLYKVRYFVKRGSTSFGETKYYEDDESRLVVDLMDAHLSTTKSRPWKNYMLARLWRDRVLKKTSSDPEYEVQEILVMENGEWTPVKTEFYPPEVKIVRA